MTCRLTVIPLQNSEAHLRSSEQNAWFAVHSVLKIAGRDGECQARRNGRPVGSSPGFFIPLSVYQPQPNCSGQELCSVQLCAAFALS